MHLIFHLAYAGGGRKRRKKKNKSESSKGAREEIGKENRKTVLKKSKVALEHQTAKLAPEIKPSVENAEKKLVKSNPLAFLVLVTTEGPPPGSGQRLIPSELPRQGPEVMQESNSIVNLQRLDCASVKISMALSINELVISGGNRLFKWHLRKNLEINYSLLTYYLIILITCLLYTSPSPRD